MTDEKLLRILEYIQENLDGTIRQDEAARLLKMSPASFSRFFRQNARKTFIGMVNELRIGEAGRLLVETDAPITEIAMAVGYANLSNFNEQFRKIRGMTPREYRNVMIQMLTHPEATDSLSPSGAGPETPSRSGPGHKRTEKKAKRRSKISVSRRR